MTRCQNLLGQYYTELIYFLKKNTMTLPELNADGYLDPGIYLTSLEEVLERFGTSPPTREHQGNLLRLIVESARKYPTIKRILLWGSFVSAKPEPGDLDYSIIVDPRHHSVQIEPADERFSHHSMPEFTTVLIRTI